jgi:hypothetical protein
LAWVFGDDCWVQGRSDDQRELLDAEVSPLRKSIDVDQLRLSIGDSRRLLL